MKKVYVRMTVKIPEKARYKATDKDGCVFFHEYHPGLGKGMHLKSDGDQWFGYVGYDKIMFNNEDRWVDCIDYIFDEEKGCLCRYKFYIDVPDDDKWLVMTRLGHVCSCKEEPWVTRTMDLEEEQEAWCTKGHFTYVTETNIPCEKWKESKIYIP